MRSKNGRGILFILLVASVAQISGLSMFGESSFNENHAILVYAVDELDDTMIVEAKAVELDGVVFVVAFLIDPDTAQKPSYEQEKMLVTYDSGSGNFVRLPGVPSYGYFALFVVNNSVIVLYDSCDEGRFWMSVYNITSMQLISRLPAPTRRGAITVGITSTAFMYRSRPHAVISAEQEIGSEYHVLELFDFLSNETRSFELPTTESPYYYTGNSTHMMIATESYIFIYHESSDLTEPSLVLEMPEELHITWDTDAVLTDDSVELWTTTGEDAAFVEHRVLHPDNSTEMQIHQMLYGAFGWSVRFVPSVGSVMLFQATLYIDSLILFALIPNEHGVYSVTDLETAAVVDSIFGFVASDHVLAIYVGYSDEENTNDKYGLSGKAHSISIAGDFSELGKLPDAVEWGFTFVQRYRTLLIVATSVVVIAAVAGGYVVFRRSHRRKQK